MINDVASYNDQSIYTSLPWWPVLVPKMPCVCARIIVEHIIGQPKVTASILAGERNRTSYPDYTQLLTSLVRSATYLS